MVEVITFYSFKGGVARSMALANAGVLLANWGYKVLMVDFDLEAPGLENFFSRTLEVAEVQKTGGVIDLLSETRSKSTAETDNWKKYVNRIRLPRISGDLGLLTVGERSLEYFKRFRNLDFAEL